MLFRSLNENGPDGNIDFQYGLTMLSGSSPALEQFYQADGVGSTADVTDGTDTLKASYTYDPWGKLLNPIDALGTKDKFKFTGEALDPQTGLYYLRARYYDPAVGEFISPDKRIGNYKDPTTLNRYEYARNNPMGFVDPSGFSAEQSGPIRLTGGFGFRSAIAAAYPNYVGAVSIINPGVVAISSQEPPPGCPPSLGNLIGCGNYSVNGTPTLPSSGLSSCNASNNFCGTVPYSPPAQSGGCDTFGYCPPVPTEPTFNPGDYDYLHPSPPDVPIEGDWDTGGYDFGDIG